MTETRCRWDRERQEYVTEDGETCDTPKREHCGARRSCSIHLGWGEQTCARCVGRTRANIRHIGDVAPLLMVAALESRSINSEAANLAGPAADVEAWSWRKVAAMQGVSWHLSAVEEDDEHHPYTVLTRWAMMLTEDYRHDRPDKWTIASAAKYLDGQLSKVAQDEGQDFGLLLREIKACREHLDAALSVRQFVQRGAPCPTCVQSSKVDPAKVRLGRVYPHYCDDEDCCQVHVETDEADVWVCPRNREHWWSQHDYVRWVEERRGA